MPAFSSESPCPSPNLQGFVALSKVAHADLLLSFKAFPIVFEVDLKAFHAPLIASLLSFPGYILQAEISALFLVSRAVFISDEEFTWISIILPSLASTAVFMQITLVELATPGISGDDQDFEDRNDEVEVPFVVEDIFLSTFLSIFLSTGFLAPLVWAEALEANNPKIKTDITDIVMILFFILFYSILLIILQNCSTKCKQHLYHYRTNQYNVKFVASNCSRLICHSRALPVRSSERRRENGIPPLSDSNWIPAGVYPREDGGRE